MGILMCFVCVAVGATIGLGIFHLLRMWMRRSVRKSIIFHEAKSCNRAYYSIDAKILTMSSSFEKKPANSIRHEGMGWREFSRIMKMLIKEGEWTFGPYDDENEWRGIRVK